MHFRIVITILLFILISLLGYFRDTYLFNFLDRERPVIIERYEANRIFDNIQNRDKQVIFIQTTPKWISAFLYSIIYLGLGTLLIHVFFRKSKYTLFTFWIYSGIIFLSILLIGISVLFHAFQFGYLAGQPLKNLVQSPLLAFIMFVYFLVLKGKGTE